MLRLLERPVQAFARAAVVKVVGGETGLRLHSIDAVERVVDPSVTAAALAGLALPLGALLRDLRLVEGNPLGKDLLRLLVLGLQLSRWDLADHRRPPTTS